MGVEEETNWAVVRRGERESRGPREGAKGRSGSKGSARDGGRYRLDCNPDADRREYIASHQSMHQKGVKR
jgi:hypothetical protein